MSDRTVTVTVPSSLYEHLQQGAQQSKRSIEDEVVVTLAAAVPVEVLPSDFEATLASLGSLDDETLWRLARSRVADEDASRLDELGDPTAVVSPTMSCVRLRIWCNGMTA
ncbi:MAG: hypothetical protein AB7R89_05595 [Dehalococcoidia bacterium]